MSTLALPLPATSSAPGVLRHSAWDALLVGLTLGQAVLLFAFPIAPVFALALWWNSNTVAHYFLHRPFFTSALVNRAFSFYLSILLGVPQTLWRERHLAHHAGVAHRWRWSKPLVAEALGVLGLWTAVVLWSPSFFLTVYLPGYVAGLTLGALHGYYEHAHGTTSHYGWLYNFIFLNDGYHVEHHAHPGEHWTRLRRHAGERLGGSRWPAVLRWLDMFSLDGLERLVLRWRWLQRLVLERHERSIRRLMQSEVPPARILIVGGGLFPRSMLVLHKLYPEAEITILDGSEANLALARTLAPIGVNFLHAWYEPRHARGYDLLVVPLALRGNRPEFYDEPAAPRVLVHDWLWHRHQQSAIVSWFFLKRINLVRSCER